MFEFEASRGWLEVKLCVWEGLWGRGWQVSQNLLCNSILFDV